MAELDGAGETMAPFVCEDSLFCLGSSGRPRRFDLYVSRRTQSGWGAPRNLLPDSVPMNTAGSEFRPSVLLRVLKKNRNCACSSSPPTGQEEWADMTCT